MTLGKTARYDRMLYQDRRPVVDQEYSSSNVWWHGRSLPLVLLQHVLQDAVALCAEPCCDQRA